MDLKEQMATRKSSGTVSTEQQLQAIGIKLPVLPESFGADVEAMQTGNQSAVSVGWTLWWNILHRILSSEDKQVELNPIGIR
jgi:hypothetical protein